MSLIDTHCHIDRYADPLREAINAEKQNIITVGVTSLPSHYQMGYKHVEHFKKVHLALGFHPALVNKFRNEICLFEKLVSRSFYIGEIGLDFSKTNKYFANLQMDVLNRILESINKEKHFISIHSRMAECEVLSILQNHNNPLCVFHWYSGSIVMLKKILNQGHYFSINPSMINSINGQRIINIIPRNRLLTETDGPFTEINKRKCHPADVGAVINYLSYSWGEKTQYVIDNIWHNYNNYFKELSLTS
jgi:TatD DNase family protein